MPCKHVQYHICHIVLILTVDDLSVVLNQRLDKTLGLELTDGNAGKRAVQTKTIDQHRLSNELVGGNFLEETLVGRFIQDNHVVSLVLDLLGGPFLQHKVFNEQIGLLQVILIYTFLAFLPPEEEDGTACLP